MNKTALITGATSGIGQATAALFAANRIDLIITGRREERLIALAKQLALQHGVSVTTLCFDIQNQEETLNALNSLPMHKQEIDILVNNAGLAAGKDPVQNGLLDDWNQMIDTNIKGLLYVTKTVAPWMIKRQSGHIFNIGSLAGKEVYPNGNVYCATKHAVDSLSRSMRLDLVNEGIKVSNIAPGLVETEFSMVRFHGDEKQANATYAGYDPLTAEDIAECIWFAASRPKHVNVADMLLLPAAQANSVTVVKNN